MTLSDFRQIAEDYGATLTFSTSAVAVFRGQDGVEVTVEFPLTPQGRLAHPNMTVLTLLDRARVMVRDSEPVAN